ncbi:MAG: four helix bundle protein [Pseudomonadota bacterium]
MLDHEKLDVYQCAIEFLAVSVKVMKSIPKGHSSLVDQLKRASWSIPLNIAEGCGKTGPADKERFYAIARGSAMECAAALDVCGVLRITDPKLQKEGKVLLTRVVAMLTKMCRPDEKYRARSRARVGARSRDQ